MLVMKATCERCGCGLPADHDEAMICSFECTFCRTCGEALGSECPNCRGLLVARPTRVGEALRRYPAAGQAAG